MVVKLNVERLETRDTPSGTSWVTVEIATMDGGRVSTRIDETTVAGWYDAGTTVITEKFDADEQLVWSTPLSWGISNGVGSYGYNYLTSLLELSDGVIAGTGVANGDMVTVRLDGATGDVLTNVVVDYGDFEIGKVIVETPTSLVVTGDSWELFTDFSKSAVFAGYIDGSNIGAGGVFHFDDDADRSNVFEAEWIAVTGEIRLAGTRTALSDPAELYVIL